MVGHHAQGDVHILLFPIFLTGLLRKMLDQRLEHVGVVVRLLVLYCHAKTLKAHAGIDMLGG